VLAAYQSGAVDPGRIFRFLYVGRLSIEKGLDDLLEAFRQIRKKR